MQMGLSYSMCMFVEMVYIRNLKCVHSPNSYYLSIFHFSARHDVRCLSLTPIPEEEEKRNRQRFDNNVE